MTMKIICFSTKDFKSLVKPGDLVRFSYSLNHGFGTCAVNLFMVLLKDLNNKNIYSIKMDFCFNFMITMLLVSATTSEIRFLYENKLIHIDKFSLKNVFLAGNYIEFEKLN